MLPTMHLSTGKSTKLRRLSHYLIRCVQMISIFGSLWSVLHGAIAQTWYMDHASHMLDKRKCTKFKRLSHYLIRCVHRADFHFVEAYGLYYSYTQYWTHSSKGYLVHGPYFPRYTYLDIRKCTKFRRLSHYRPFYGSLWSVLLVHPILDP